MSIGASLPPTTYMPLHIEDIDVSVSDEESDNQDSSEEDSGLQSALFASLKFNAFKQPGTAPVHSGDSGLESDGDSEIDPGPP